MAFASGTAAGAAGKAAAIDALVADGAKIIADDIFYLSEPFFQDGQVAQAVDRARAAGVLYLASAGNRARQSRASDNAPLASGITDNLTTTLPSEVATWSNTTGSAVTVGLRIVRYTAAHSRGRRSPGSPWPRSGRR
jgi:hypothetical protein